MMFSANFPRNTLKFDLFQHLSLKDILKVCFHNIFTHKIEGKIPDEDMKNVAEKPVTREVVAILDCQERGSKSLGKKYITQ